MATIEAVRRLSPRVRRLLAEHDVDARGLPGTGAEGRVRPRDVLTAVGVPHPPADGAVLASPLARRMLHEAGIDLVAAAAAAGGRRVTRAEAEDVISERSTTGRDAPRDGVGQPVGRGGTVVVDAAVDVAALLAVVATVQPAFVARNGFRLDLDVPVAVAVTAALAGDPGGSALRRRGTVVTAFHVGGPDGASLRTVGDAQDLTTAGLARRARSATPAPIGDRSTQTPTVTITTDPSAPVADLVDATEIGVLEVGEPALREVRRTDRLGHEAVHALPHLTLRLHHDDRVDEDDARALLTGVCRALTTWSLPVGP